MKRWIGWSARLYPASWRRRYGGEFEALLEDAKLTPADLWDVLREALCMQMKIWTFGRVAGVCGLAGLAIALIVAARTPSNYVSTAVMRVDSTPQQAGETLDRAERQILSRTSLAKIVRDGGLYEGERRSRPLEDILRQMRDRDITIRVLHPASGAGGPGMAFSVSFRYPEPAKAQWVTRMLLASLREAIPAAQKTSWMILDPASLPARPVSPNRGIIVTAGLGLGLFAGCLIFGIGRWPKVALTGVAAGLLALIGSYFVPDRYLSNAVVRVSDQQSAQLVGQWVTDGAFLRWLVQNPQLAAYRGRPADEAVDRIRRNLRVQVLNPGAVLISFQDANREQAQAVVRDIVAHVIETNLRRGATVMEVLDPASLPDKPIWPNRAVLAGLGLLAGALLGAAWQVHGRYRTPAPRPA